MTLSEGGSLATMAMGNPISSFVTAASKAVMRADRHYAQFTVGTLFGVIRPGWDVEGRQHAHHVDGHCFYSAYFGRRFPDGLSWEGLQRAKEEGDCIGLLLDLDQGSLTVYKNDERLGVMATGLSGEYCWALSMAYQGCSVRIESTALPCA